MTDRATECLWVSIPTRVDQNSTEVGTLRHELEYQTGLFNAQAQLDQQFLESQAGQIAGILLQHGSVKRFKLPAQIFLPGENRTLFVSPGLRDRVVSGLIKRHSFSVNTLRFSRHIHDLECTEDLAVQLGVGLIRYSIARYLVYEALAEGRSVHYAAENPWDIPCIPHENSDLAETVQKLVLKDAGMSVNVDGDRLSSAFISAARRFYLPQWVALDSQHELLVSSMDEAEACIASMQHYLEVLTLASQLAPYFIADEVYQRKRYGIQGQLVNQGRALAYYHLGKIVQAIKIRANMNRLNRGFSLSLPYFDDQEMVMKHYDFVVIPTGRILFVPSFVVLAARKEQMRVAQDARFSPSTRQHLQGTLQTLEMAFYAASFS